MSHYPVHSHKSLEKWFLIAILVAAFIFRFNHLKTAPPGLYPDEAVNGTDALKALEAGNLSAEGGPGFGWKTFYPNNNGREGLFINIQAVFLKYFGPHVWVLRLPSAIFGFLTVLGLYLLARRLFNWQIAAIASWFLATGFWHVNFSRIGFRAILAPFFTVWALYFLNKALARAKIWHFILSGAFLGLGFYTYLGFRVVPLIFIFTLLAYWQRIKKDYSHEEYLHLRLELARGIALFVIATFLVFLPLGLYFLQNPGDFFGRAGQVSIFNSSNPLKELLWSSVKTLGMFNFAGDYNWRHNLSGSPQLLWPVGIFFVIGIFRSFGKLFKRYKTHGHISTIQTLLISWFFVALLPSVLSNEGLPHALRSIGAIPVAMIFAAEGAWWIFETLKHWYRSGDLHLYETPLQKEHEASILVGLVLIILLFTIGIYESNKYFNLWARDPHTADAFSADLVEIGNKINQLPLTSKKYVIVNLGGVLVDDLPMPAQTVMFISQTYTNELQKQKNVVYLTEEEYEKSKNDIAKQKNATIFKLAPSN